MAQARSELEWNQTSCILAMLYNNNRGDAPPAKPQDFNPLTRKKKPAMPKSPDGKSFVPFSMEFLQKLFVDSARR